MQTKLSADYAENVKMVDEALNVDGNFDIIKKRVRVGKDEMTLYYVDGFVKDGVMEKLMLYFVSLDGLGILTDLMARNIMEAHVPYVETDVTESVESMLDGVLSGMTLMIGSSFGTCAILIDARTYPARETAEPENDRVMLGARDGFVETFVFNTALIRRRIRDTALKMHYINVGDKSKTDVF